MTFEQALRLSGLRPRDIVADGQWRRCATDDKPRKRNGAYCLHPDGRGYWRNWATDSDLNSWADSSVNRAAQVDPAIVERRRQEERAARLKAIRGAREFWANAVPMREPHPYLDGKGLSALGTHGLRRRGDMLVVPVMWRGRLVSVQTISPEGEKRFWPGAPVKGGHHEISRARPAMTVFCEGLATGLAVFQCVKAARVFVAFDAGNLYHALQELAPTGNVVFAADNDHGTMARRGFNPGIEKAKNCAELIGAGVAWPQDIDGTDWADALREYGLTGAKRIERQILAQSRYVMGRVPM